MESLLDESLYRKLLWSRHVFPEWLVNDKNGWFLKTASCYPDEPILLSAMKSAHQDLPRITKYLIDHGANVNETHPTTKANALTVLLENIALWRETHIFSLVETALVLFEEGIDETIDGVTHPIAFLKLIVRFLLSRGIDINCCDGNGNNFLALFAKDVLQRENLDRKIELAQMLIDSGINVNNRNKLGRDALLLLCTRDAGRRFDQEFPQILKLLVESGACINAYDYARWSNALMLAIESTSFLDDGTLSAVQALIQYGINVHYVNYARENVLGTLLSKRKAPLDRVLLFARFLLLDHRVAAMNGLEEFLESRFPHKISMNNQGGYVKSGRTRFAYSASNERAFYDILELLLQQQDAGRCEMKSKVLHLICLNYEGDNFLEILQFLIQCGANVNSFHDRRYNHFFQGTIDTHFTVAESIELNVKQKPRAGEALALLHRYGFNHSLSSENRYRMLGCCFNYGRRVNICKALVEKQLTGIRI